LPPIDGGDVTQSAAAAAIVATPITPIV
jgi:hypothetical protein